ncbi:DUF3306 domain-containing protein [Limnohabitans sp. DCL3]|uniref:DUF3306 domain-containing protein n=1 Tax=Limnohabitans sp. DCL3 TaxID=3374103 RepID=UPI003A89FE02
MSDNFFSRWSRRKQGLETQEVNAGREARTPAPSLASGAQGGTNVAAGPVPEVTQNQAVASESEPQPPLPTMADVEQLTPSSEFKGFMRQGVPGEVRNAAMKKLFTDPHFNVMDGLDIYIGDYNTPDPLPAGMLEKMVGAQLLGLLTPKDPDAAEGPPLVAKSPPSHLEPHLTAQPTSALPVSAPTEHDHPDLQLQPNDAPASPSPGPSTG